MKLKKIRNGVIVVLSVWSVIGTIIYGIFHPKIGEIILDGFFILCIIGVTAMLFMAGYIWDEYKSDY